MPAPKGSAKRKSLPSPDVVNDRSEATKRRRKGRRNAQQPSKDRIGSTARIGRIALKFIEGFGKRLEAKGKDVTKAAVVPEIAFRAAIAALPEGKLKAELRRDEHASLEQLATVIRSIQAAEQTMATSNDTDRNGGDAFGGVIPCTPDLYARARAQAKTNGKNGDKRMLQALAMNPRAPVDLLAEALGATDVDQPLGDKAADVACAAAVVKNLAEALAVDWRAHGLGFLGQRAAVAAETLAEAIAIEALAGNDNHNSDGASGRATEATDGLGWILRILHSFALAPYAQRAPPAAGIEDSLLLPFLPKQSPPPAPDSQLAAESDSRALRCSIARLLAHYSIGLAALTGEGGGANAAKVIEQVRTAATAVIIKTNRIEDSTNAGDSSSDESSDEDRWDAGSLGASGVHSLSQHLLTLCAVHLHGDEACTLEFLRCVGKACFEPSERLGEGQVLLPMTAADALALTCARALARVLRPNAFPAPTAAGFLKRAYAMRVVEALRHAHVPSLAPKPWAGVATNEKIDYGPQWDFVGASAAPGTLLDFLARPEAPDAIGNSVAVSALRELARRRSSPAAVGEALRSSPACGPSALGPLLLAVETLNTSGGGLGQAKSAGDQSGDRDNYALAGGFFVDTAGGGTGATLAPLGGKGLSGSRASVIDMDEEDEEQSGSAGADEPDEGSAQG